MGSIEESIRDFDFNYQKERSSNIFILEKISKECLSHHKKYLYLESGEKPLLILNGHKNILSRLMPFTGIVLTNKKIHFLLLKNSKLSSIIPIKEKLKSLEISSIFNIKVGNYDSCIGSAYVGHELEINNQVFGLVRMGYSILCDEKAIEYLNGVFNHLSGEGVFLSGNQENIKNEQEGESSALVKTLLWTLSPILVIAFIKIIIMMGGSSITSLANSPITNLAKSRVEDVCSDAWIASDTVMSAGKIKLRNTYAMEVSKNDWRAGVNYSIDGFSAGFECTIWLEENKIKLRVTRTGVYD